MAKSKKTNAERILDQHKLDYTSIAYDITDDLIDGISVADKIGKSHDVVFKTLVTKGHGRDLYVFVIPVAGELDMKKAARACGEKKIEMIPVRDIQKHTGYIRGGCSPIGMKKNYHTYIHESIKGQEEIVVSAGKKGAQISLSPASLVQVTSAEFVDIVRE